MNWLNLSEKKILKYDKLMENGFNFFSKLWNKLFEELSIAL
jgi:hypothetical protein